MARVRLNKGPTLRLSSKDESRQLHRLMADALNEALKSIGYFVIPSGGMIEGDFRGKLNFALSPLDSNAAQAEEQAQFNRWAPSYGLTAAHYKRQFTSRGVLYELIGFAPSRAKYSFRGRAVYGGKEMLFGDFVLAQVLEKKS